MHDDVIRAMRAAERLRRWARQGTWRRMARAGVKTPAAHSAGADGVMAAALHSLQGWAAHRIARSH